MEFNNKTVPGCLIRTFYPHHGISRAVMSVDGETKDKSGDQDSIQSALDQENCFHPWNTYQEHSISLGPVNTLLK